MTVLDISFGEITYQKKRSLSQNHKTIQKTEKNRKKVANLRKVTHQQNSNQHKIENNQT